MLKYLVLGPVFALCMTLGALAQEAAQSPSASPGYANDFAAKLKSLDPSKDSHLAKAMTFCEVSGTKAFMLQRLDQLVPAIVKIMRVNSPHKDDDKYWVAVENAMTSEMKDHLDELILLSADVYAQHFTDAELDQLIAFYKSDVGKKYLAERPQLVTEANAVGQLWAQALAGDLLKREQTDQKSGSKGSL